MSSDNKTPFSVWFPDKLEDEMGKLQVELGKLQAELGKLQAELGKLQVELDPASKPAGNEPIVQGSQTSPSDTGTDSSRERSSGPCCHTRPALSATVDVTLDPDTANRYLVLSEDRKSVRHRNRRQALPNTPERFVTYPEVLGAEGFAGGRHYWEVEVGDKPEWELGVCRESVSRKGESENSPRNGYWVMLLRDGEYEASTSPSTLLPVSARPSRVGVFLDYEAGEVSFYNVTDGSHLFTFTDTFSGTLRPYFYLGLCPGGTNVEPLTICPVLARAKGNPGPVSGGSEERGAQQGESSDSPGRAEAEGTEEEIPLCSMEAGYTPNGPC
nr:E3 ubiquitin-protein ligase TRIM39-like [Pelodiscus sinensis]|eukprot:XP_025042356.1 E3 ubiquitin-protein ligase TRIM39-like [Pelodiscus sinensis]